LVRAVIDARLLIGAAHAVDQHPVAPQVGFAAQRSTRDYSNIAARNVTDT
jgi:hypothetical protein